MQIAAEGNALFHKYNCYSTFWLRIHWCWIDINVCSSVFVDLYWVFQYWYFCFTTSTLKAELNFCRTGIVFSHGLRFAPGTLEPVSTSMAHVLVWVVRFWAVFLQLLFQRQGAGSSSLLVAWQWPRLSVSKSGLSKHTNGCAHWYLYVGAKRRLCWCGINSCGKLCFVFKLNFRIKRWSVFYTRFFEGYLRLGLIIYSATLCFDTNF